MSAFIGVATTDLITTGTTVKTLVQILLPANHRGKVLGWNVSFRGIVSTDSQALVRALFQTTAGTMSALTPSKWDPSLPETLQTTAQHTATGTEPTAGVVVFRGLVHPQAAYEVLYPPGQEIPIAGGSRFGIEVTTPVSVSATAWIKFEE